MKMCFWFYKKKQDVKHIVKHSISARVHVCAQSAHFLEILLCVFHASHDFTDAFLGSGHYLRQRGGGGGKGGT